MAQQEMKPSSPSKGKPSAEVVEKLAQGYRYVTVPATDIYEHEFGGITISGGHGVKGDLPGFSYHFGPGKHLLSPEFADEVEERLRIWSESMIRLMRPGAHKASVSQATRRGVEFDANPPETI